jgi:dephospho-CoA kinase
VSKEYLEWRDQLEQLDQPPRVCVTEVPLLYEAGGDTRFDRVIVITAPRRLREVRRGAPIDEREQRLLPDREKVRRADYHYRNVGTEEDLDAWVAGVMGLLTQEQEPA